LEPITDRFGTTYQVEFERDPLWIFRIRAGYIEIGRIYCDGNPPVLELRDIRFRDDIPAKETILKQIWRKLAHQPGPLLNYRDRGLGSAMLNQIERLAWADGFRVIEGWISSVDTDQDPDLPNWYRRRGFEVQLFEGTGPKRATISKELHPWPERSRPGGTG
jgi:hypothetical protein